MVTLNLAVLEEFVGTSPALKADMLRTFRQVLREAVDEAAGAGAMTRVDILRIVAHRLKSSARLVGALPLGDICAELEAAAITGAIEEVDRYHRLLISEQRQVTAAVDLALARLQAAGQG